MRRAAAFLGLALAVALLGACGQAAGVPAGLRAGVTAQVEPGGPLDVPPGLATASGVVVTHEVVEVTAEGYIMRITRLNQELTRYWTRDLAMSHHEVHGQPLNRFEPPALYFAWPLVDGKDMDAGVRVSRRPAGRPLHQHVARRASGTRWWT